MEAEAFLELYRQMEDALEQRYQGAKRRYSSVVLEYMNERESVPFREKLDTCREIRNLLTHNCKIDGESVVTPAPSLCKALQQLVDYLRRPPMALDFATKAEDIFCAGIQQTVLKIMGIMDKAGFSHVPILEEEQFVGVFSHSTVFSYVLASNQKPIHRQTTMQELQGLLPLKMHTENYEFAPATLTCAQAREKFENPSAKNRRLAVIFITQNGGHKEPLLGMLTPWDVLGDKQQDAGAPT